MHFSDVVFQNRALFACAITITSIGNFKVLAVKATAVSTHTDGTNQAPTYNIRCKGFLSAM